MKKYIYPLFVASFCIWAGACSKDFEETNTDPNNLSKITAGSTLNPVLYSLASQNAKQMRSNTAPLMQMFLQTDDFNNSPFFYDFDQNIGASTWNNYYTNLSNIEEMREAAVRDALPNYEAIALTLKAYAYSVLTDCFGDIPMASALQAEEDVWYPEFSPQEDIYAQLLTDLEYANSIYDAEQGMPYVSDILYQNNVQKWRKFTNSLHLRLLLRISNRPETRAFDKITEMVNNPESYPVFDSGDEAAVLHLDGIAPTLSPWDRPQDFGVFRYYTEFFIDNLKNFEDPRIGVFASKARGLESEDYGYIGQPTDFVENPLPDSIATASGVKRSLAEAPLIIPIMSYAEVEFIKAEMAQRGYIDDARSHYENGVRAAIEMWSQEVPEGYFDNPHAAYDGSLERILLQKYYDLFFTDYQSWFEQRRTGLPNLPTTASMLNEGEMPSRFYYPINEANSNFQNYQEAVTRMGGDEINVKVWWDRNN
ncbi:SusD/RagB family nutrient-binding outer membrane lipoprotein [Echinicola salinicaeni]|uniref:SusD/RagB family nutrient-binding outer membrane lipoprotein n=1 Tax=Echinicola salinicaeni TaxID=2762757 RepID=UPI00164845E1|nr:SusD/RagB family nutrient-binding outer membrane lipoprotein [Echinicola salinicaeni]